jgi:uncharacterized spore protein YtfJ
MNAADTLEKMSNSLGSHATVKSVFGDPIQVDGKTVVPIAKIAYGFGAGGGSHPGRHNGDGTDASGERTEGGGGGGGVRAFPAGALEITATGTRFIQAIDLRWLAGAFAAGALLGSILFARRPR